MAPQLPYLGAHTWQSADGEVSVAYVEALSVWVAAGSPVGPLHLLVDAVRAFVAAAAGAGARAAFFGLPAELAAAAGLRVLRLGEEPLWRAASWGNFALRPEAARQRRRATRLGVVVEKVTAPGAPGAAAEAAELHALQRRWLAGRALAPLQFVARATLRTRAPGATRWVARAQGRVVGLAVLLPGAPTGTWLLEQLLRDPRAPNGCSELLVHEAMAHVAARAPQAQVSLGIVALAGPLAWPLRAVRTLGRPLYPFAGLRRFRGKLRPDAVAPLFLAHPPTLGALRACAAVAVVFTGKRPLRFAWRSLVAGPPPLVGAMAAALVPWTWALSRLPATFFASAASQRAWVGFDILLTLALARLAARPRLRWARVLAWVVTLDAVVTTCEVVWSPAPPVSLGLHVLACTLAVGAPALAARVLWGCVHRLARAQR